MQIELVASAYRPYIGILGSLVTLETLAAAIARLLGRPLNSHYLVVRLTTFALKVTTHYVVFILLLWPPHYERLRGLDLY